MVTARQLFCGHVKRKIKKHRVHSPALSHSPQRRGTCIAIRIEKPKKPNSAERKIALIRLTTLKRIRAAIPGIGHNLKRFSRVLVRGGRTRDVVGIRCKIIRGKFDAAPVNGRRTSRSKYGVRRL